MEISSVPRPRQPLSSPFETPYVSLESLKSKLEEVGLSTKPIVVQALTQAIVSHREQRRDSGGPYLEEHIYPVVLAGIEHEQRIGHRVSAKFVAMLLTHDVPEDDKAMPLSRFRLEFGRSEVKPFRPGRSVADLVTPLTKLDTELFPGKTEKERKQARDSSYYKGLAQAEYETVIGKIVDRGLNILSLHLCAPDKIERKIKETEQHYLEMARNYSPFYFEVITTRIGELREWMKLSPASKS